VAKTYRVTFRAKAANTMLGFLLRHGRGPGFMRLLTVEGRRSGTPHSTPVVPVLNDSGRWLVSPFGQVGWVRNARAAGQVTLSRGKDSENFSVTELGPDDAVPVLREYLAMKPAGKYVKAYFDVDPGSSAEDFAAEAPRHPVFELRPSSSSRSTT
jgi:deazaflavin-dependent oxidoreductase (nitroreductase family)